MASLPSLRAFKSHAAPARTTREQRGNGDKRGRRCAASERGFTIVELSVAMLIMTIFAGLIVNAIIHLVTPTLQTQAVRDSSDQLNLAFMELDSNVRYASEIWAPYAGTSGHTWDLLFLSTYNGATQNTCNELQDNYLTGQLLQTNWAEGSTTTPTFKVLVNNLTGSADPFQIVSNSSFEEVQLQVSLAAVSGSGAAQETTKSSVTFTALNSTSNAAASGTACNATWTAS